MWASVPKVTEVFHSTAITDVHGTCVTVSHQCLCREVLTVRLRHYLHQRPC